MFEDVRGRSWYEVTVQGSVRFHGDSLGAVRVDGNPLIYSFGRKDWIIFCDGCTLQRG